MGDPRKLRKKYSTPKHPFEKERIEQENEIVKQFGLKNKKEVWKADTKIRNYRKQARHIQADRTERKEQRKNDLLQTLRKLGLIKDTDTLEAVLDLTIEDLLARRLQTVVFRKNLAHSIKQARQFIIHGHISIQGIKTTVPGYILPLALEGKIDYYGEPPKIEAPKVEATVEETKPVIEERAPETKPIVPKRVLSTKPSIPKKEEAKPVIPKKEEPVPEVSK